MIVFNSNVITISVHENEKKKERKQICDKVTPVSIFQIQLINNKP
jgi:hypothetical protein